LEERITRNSSREAKDKIVPSSSGGVKAGNTNIALVQFFGDVSLAAKAE